MKKKLIKFSIFFIIIITLLITYLTLIGINTEKFIEVIKSQVLKSNNKINLELKNVKFLLNPRNLSINIKTFSPKILINNKELKFVYIKTNISLKSFINKNFSVENLQISTNTIKLIDLVALIKSFKNSTEMFLLKNIIKGGLLIGDLNLNFDKNGKIKDDYEIKGFIKEGKINVLRKYFINDLNLVFIIRDKEYYLGDIEGKFNQLNLSLPSIKIKEKNNQYLVDGRLLNKNKDIGIKLLNNFVRNNVKNYGIEDIKFSSVNDFNFQINKKLKIKDFKLESKINLDKLIYKNNSLNIKKYLPNFKNLIKLKNHKIVLNYKNNKLSLKGKGDVSIENNTDSLTYELSKSDDIYDFKTIADIEKNIFLLNLLDYQKKKGVKSKIILSGSYNKDKEIRLKSVSFIDNNKNFFKIKNLDLNKNFKIKNINELDLNFINNNKIKNQISIKKKNKNYEIKGKSFDASSLINEILNGDNTKESSSIFTNTNTNIDIDIDKIYLDKVTFVNDLNGDIIFKHNKIKKLNLVSIFPNNKKLILTVNLNKNSEKITTLSSDYPKPLVKKYKFIKGFEEGILDFYSIKKNGISNSILKIDNFKVQEVPVLAKLLTLASLQGIADLLTGEGIRFTDFEMKFSNEKKLLRIEEMYAIGPAISILMDGYIESNELISLRGTLVPATTINRTIASIPLIGKILVGDKVGEGVFGVSFKIKGSSEDLKTTVNPVKTLTPRFITRTLEKIKKN